MPAVNMRQAFSIMSVRNPQVRAGSGHPLPTFEDIFDPQTGGSVFGNGSDTSLGNIWNFITGHKHQANMQLEQQEFDEYMYNQYNSPEAIKRQFQDAGINTNLIGSSSFGTAQSSAGAPAVNGSSNPVSDASSIVESLASAASLAADPALKAAQVATEVTLPELNRALTAKYGVDALFTDIQYQTANQLLEWSRQDRECTALTLRMGFFQACQNYRNSMQEFDNLVKQGELLDNEINRADWEAKIKEETYNMLVDHHYLPDADYLNRFFIDYVQNQDYAGFDKFMNGFTWMQDNLNRSAARFGAYGNTIKIGPVEVPLEYLLQSGKDLGEFVDEVRNTDTSVSGFKWPWQKDESESTDSNENVPKRIRKKFGGMRAVVSAVKKVNPNASESDLYDALRDEGYSREDIGYFLDYGMK